MSLAACGSDDGPAALAGDEYVAAMVAICATTDQRLAELPEPPEQISASDWATEVALALRAEQASAEALVVDAEVRSDHGIYTTTTGDIADLYDELGRALAQGDAGSAVTDVSTGITELSLGRDDVARGLGLDECARSSS